MLIALIQSCLNDLGTTEEGDFLTAIKVKCIVHLVILLDGKLPHRHRLTCKHGFIDYARAAKKYRIAGHSTIVGHDYDVTWHKVFATNGQQAFIVIRLLLPPLNLHLALVSGHFLNATVVGHGFNK